VLAGRYAIERLVGRGGMAVVYLARDLRHVRDVAVKVFQLESEEPGEGSQRFLQEIQIAARLSHPNILPLHDSGEAEGLLYYVMPYVPGETLRQRLDREGALPVADALRIAADVAGALAYAHSHGVIHRDIKPENILFISDHAVVADFGIARAISAGGWDEWKLAGPAGTPTYMSPEQARGGSRVDGRSDVYSLGCVLYEMLTGEPPFRGSTPEEVVVQHLESEPLPVHTRRPALTRDLQAVVGKALAKHPADRHQTAQQMADALARLQAGHGALDDTGGSLRQGPTGIPSATSSGSWVRRWAGPAMAALGIAAATVWTMAARSTRLDASLVYVGPLIHREGVPADFGSEQCSRLIYDAVNQWKDLRVVDRFWAQDQLAQVDGTPTLDNLLSIARRIRAGRLLSGEVYTWGDSVKVRGVLYDVAHGPDPIREQTVVIPRGDLALAQQRLGELADSLMLPAPHEVAAAPGITGTRRIGAWQVYDSAHGDLASWNLEAAAARFRTALARDSHYALAHLWLAQTMNWMGEDASTWRDDAATALEPGSGLPGTERDWGQALLALAEGRYQDACRQYDAMVKRDTLDFQGWYGRGECRRMDRTVLRDASSPSGWRFRASYHAATRDYERALRLIPSTHRAFRGAAFERLRTLFYTETNAIRAGFLENTDSLVAGAFPSLQGDTLAFQPFPIADLARNDSKAFPASTPAAVARNRERLARVASEWARAFPNSATALETFGQALELQGRLDGPDSTQAWAAVYFRRARSVAGDTGARLTASLGELRVLVKLGRYDRARKLADSLLARSSKVSGEEAGMLAGAAALTGRPLLAAELARQAGPNVRFATTSGDELSLPPALKASALAYLALAAFQVPADSLRAVDQRILSLIELVVDRRDRPAVVNATIAVPRALAFPAMGNAMTYQGTIGGNLLLRVQADLLRSDTASAHALLLRPWGSGRQVLASEVPLDLALRESQMLLLLGDTVAGRQRLEQTLSSLPATGLGLLGDNPHISIPQAAAVPLALALGADLAAYRGDHDTARKLAGDALSLIDQRSEPMQPLVERLRRLNDSRQPQ
jgi:tetratricopeptide (TPR) repeat protein